MNQTALAKAKQCVHRIEDMAFTFIFADAETAYAENAGLESFVKQRLLTVVETVLAEEDLQGHVIRIDNIAIDLIAESYADYQATLPEQLAGKLRDAIRHHLPPNSSNAQVAVMDSATHAIDVLRFYLEHGYLPWPAASIQSLEQTLIKLAQDDTEAVKGMFVRLSHPEQAAQRMVKQFSAATIMQLFHYFDAVAVASVWRRSNEIVGLCQVVKLTSSRDGLVLLLQESLVLDGLCSSASITLEDCIRHFLQRLAAMNGMTIAQLLQQLSHAIKSKQQPENDALSTLVWQLYEHYRHGEILDDITAKTAALPIDEEHRSAVPVDKELTKRLLTQLLQRIESYRRAGQEDAAKVLLRLYRQYLRDGSIDAAALTGVSNIDSVQRTMLAADEAMIKQWLAALVPAINKQGQVGDKEAEAVLLTLCRQYRRSKIGDDEPDSVLQHYDGAALPNSDISDEDAQLQDLWAQLQQAWTCDGEAEIAALCTQMLQHYPQQLLMFMRSHADTVIARKKLARYLSRALMIDILTRLMTDQRGVIVYVFNTITRRWSASAAFAQINETLSSALRGFDEQRMTALLAEYSLAYLVHSFEREFKPKQYITELLQPLSRALDISVDALLQVFKSSATEDNDALSSWIVQTLAGIESDWHETKHDPVSQHENVLQAYRYFAWLKQRISDVTQSGINHAPAMHRLVTWLQQSQPQLLMRLFNEINIHWTSSEETLTVLNEAELLSLITAWFKSTQPAADEDELEVLRTIARERNKVANVRAFYRDILYRSLNGQLLDFTEITRQPANKEEKKPANTQSSEPDLLPIYPHQRVLEALLNGYLAGMNRLSAANMNQKADGLADVAEFYRRIVRNLAQQSVWEAVDIVRIVDNAYRQSLAIDNNAESLTPSHPSQADMLVLMEDYLRYTSQISERKVASECTEDQFYAAFEHSEERSAVSLFYREIFYRLSRQRLWQSEALITTIDEVYRTAADAKTTSDTLQQRHLSQQIREAATVDSALNAQQTREAELLTQLKNYLNGATASSSSQHETLSEAISALLANQSPALHRLLRDMLYLRDSHEQLLALLSETQLIALLLQQRSNLSPLLASAEQLANAVLLAGTPLSAAQIERLKRQVILEYVFIQDRPFVSGAFSQGFGHALRQQLPSNSVQTVYWSIVEQLKSGWLAQDQEPIQRMLQALAPEVAGDTMEEAFDKANKPPQQPKQFNKQAVTDYAENIYLYNAGMVLAAPYFPSLFIKLGLIEGNAFSNRQSAERALHLLQYLVNGVTDAPEFMLVLNKVLCGVETGVPIIRSIEISDEERLVIDSLLHSIIANWKIIGNTSVSGLQESFLQREGRLRLHADAWQLQVQQRAFDMLLDQLPWSFSTIKFPWMDKMIQVQWR